MKAFDELRALAKRIRDNSIESARDEYERTMQDIAALELRLAPPAKIERPATPRSLTLINLILSCIPRDREFDVNAMRGWIREADSNRNPSADVVRTNLHRLMRQGVLKQTQRAVGKQRALFAVASLEVHHDLSTREWVERFLDQSSDPVEIMTLMLEAGWQQDGDAMLALNRVRWAMGLA